MKVLTIGRNPNSDIVVNDVKASRKHCEIIQDDSGIITIKDVGSTNGTFVNGHKIVSEERLSATDVVKIGSSVVPWKNHFTDLTVVDCNMEATRISRTSDNIPSRNVQERSTPAAPYVNIPSDININQNVRSEHADVRKRGDDFKVGFMRNMGDQMGNSVGKTLGCIVSIIIVIAFIAIISLVSFN